MWGCKSVFRYLRRGNHAAQGMQERLAVLEKGERRCSGGARSLLHNNPILQKVKNEIYIKKKLYTVTALYHRRSAL
jgi:hypothetical protein